MGTASWFGRRQSLRTLDYVGVVLVVITGAIHLYEGIEHLSEGGVIPVLFVLAGLGFFGALVLLWAGFNRTVLYLVGIVFTAIQFVAYFVLNWPDVLSPLGIFDKIVQLLLVVVLAVLYAQRGA